MKKFKIKKFMTSFLMLAVMVVSIIGLIPKTNIYASSFFSVTVTERDGSSASTSYQAVGDSDVKMYVFYIPPSGSSSYYCVKYFFISDESIDFKTTVVNNPIDSESTTSSGSLSLDNSVSVDDKTYYYGIGGGTFFTDQFRPKPNYSFNGSKKLYSTSNWDYKDDEIAKFFITGKLPVDVTVGEITSTDDYDNQPDGSQDNPMEDKDIGTIVLKSHGFIPTKNNNFVGDISATYDYYFKYKDKTSSGFSISDNKYARTFIQVRVQNQCVLFEPGDEDTVKEYYPHYGEFYQYKNLATENISNNTVKVSWGDVMLKWSDYTEHPFALNKKLAYRFMIRVICTDSLTVVPDENSGWYAGGWRSFIFDGDKFLEETNGHIDSDGNWSDDEDDGHNDSSDKTSHNDIDKDDIDKILNDDSNSLTNFVDKLKQAKNAFDTANEYIKQVLKVPTMLGKLFSFFPDWVLYPFEFAFALIPWIIIYKLLRG